MRHWWEKTACADYPDPSLWVGADKRHHTSRQEVRAKAICWEVCPVRKECLLVAIADSSKVIAGGLSGTERAALLKEHDGDRLEAVRTSVRPEVHRATA